MKVSRQRIRVTPMLTEQRVSGELTTCHLCGASVQFDAPATGHLWRECDESDQPRPGVDALLVTCASKACIRRVETHPRLYVESSEGAPGSFPMLCPKCVHRRGMGCAHKDLKANGGEGLSVSLSGLGNVIICQRGRPCMSPPKTAWTCAGQQLPGEQP